jgi:hypothetical protein
VEAHAKNRDLLRGEGLEERVGYFGRHISIDQAIVEFQEHSASRKSSSANSTNIPQSAITDG